MLAWFRGTGWTVQGQLPPDRKFILVGAPHTSNWDFLVFVGVAGHIWRRARAEPALREGLDRFVGLALAFVAAANLAVLSNHLLAGWLCLEATSSP